jgi:hypothetical protein
LLGTPGDRTALFACANHTAASLDFAFEGCPIDFASAAPHFNSITFVTQPYPGLLMFSLMSGKASL